LVLAWRSSEEHTNFYGLSAIEGRTVSHQSGAFQEAHSLKHNTPHPARNLEIK